MLHNNDNKNKKSGIVIVCIVIILLILLTLFIIFINLFDLNFRITRIKKDLFYIVQNSYLELNTELLKYNNYTYDLEEMKIKSQELINLNYPNEIIEIKSFYYVDNKIDILLSYEYIPLINLNGNEKYNMEISDILRLEMLGVSNE